MVRSSTSAAQQIVSLHVHICLPSGSCCGHAVVLLFVRALLDGRGWLQRWDFYYNEIPRHGWCYGISSRPTFQSQVLHHRRELRLVVIRCWFVGCLSTWVHPEPQGLGGATFLGITVGYATGPALFKSWSYRWEYFFSLQGCAIGCHVDEVFFWCYQENLHCDHPDACADLNLWIFWFVCHPNFVFGSQGLDLGCAEEILNN